MKILVTGANGLLGHHVVMNLLNLKHEVCIIVRSRKNIFFDLASVEIFEGNFADYHALKIAATDCNGIIHIAAVTSTRLLRYEDYEKINVEGSSTILQVAEELKICNIVFVSSANTIGYGSKNEPADEQSDFTFPFTKSFYAQSKVNAEKLFIGTSKNPNQHIVIINPTFIIGAFDPKPSSGKLMLLGYKKRLMFVPKGGKNFVAASDVAVAICNAVTEGKNGERYLASGVNHSFREFFSLQKKMGLYNQFILEVPDILLKFMGKAGDFIRLFGIKTEICSMNISQLLIREYYENKKAKADLNLPETDLKIAILETIDWFKEMKMIQ